MFNGSVLSVIMIATAPTGTLISSDAIVYRGTDETAIQIIIIKKKTPQKRWNPKIMYQLLLI